MVRKKIIKIVNPDHRGFTLIELLVAMTAAMILIGALVLVFLSQSKMSASEEEMLSLQLNLRVATQRLSHALSHAGFGSSDSFQNGSSMTGNEPGSGAIDPPITRFVSHIGNGTSGTPNLTSLSPDSVIIVYGFRKIGTEVAEIISPNSVRLTGDLSPAPDPNTGNFRRYFSFFPNFAGNVFYELTNISSRTLTFSTSVDAPRGSSAYMVVPIRIQVANFVKENRLGQNITMPVLQLKNFAYDSALGWIGAEHIEDLQIQYSIDGKTWFDSIDDSADLQKIRKIRFWVLGRSENQTGTQSQVFEITDLKANLGASDMCIVPPVDGACVIYRVGPFNDGHARMLSRGEVVLRNAS